MRAAKIEALAAGALIAAAAGLLLAVMKFPLDSRLFPMMVLVALLVCAALWLFRSLTGGGSDQAEPQAVADYRPLLAAAAITAVYGVAVSLWSYFLPTIIYIPLMAFALGNRNLLLTAASGAAFTTMVYVVFVWLFERPMPLIG